MYFAPPVLSKNSKQKAILKKTSSGQPPKLSDVPKSNQSTVEKHRRRDFYGNLIDGNKRQCIFFNMSANQVYLVENWKKFNTKH